MNAIDIVKEQVYAYDQNRDCAVVTIVQSDGSTPRSNGKMLVYKNGETKGTVGGGAVELLAIRDAKTCIAEGSNAFYTYDLSSPSSEAGMSCGGHMSVLIEVFIAKPLLVMCGAGHVGGAVLTLASFLGFNTLLIDDRDESLIADKIAISGRFVRAKDFEADIKAMNILPGAYFVIATHGHAHDGAALAGALDKEAAYVGMIGSSKKIVALFEKLRSKGIPQELLDKVYTPIGLDLGGESPQEIALAIMAEILTVKYGRTGLHFMGQEK